MESSDFIPEHESCDKIELLGIRGGTSETYKRTIGDKLYFVKQLRPEFATNKRYRAAFRKEYEVGKRINCPYIVKYQAIEENADGLCILMEYVGGVTLAEKLTTEPSYFKKKQHVKKLVRQLSKALEVLHKHNIVHMDIKPENILLTRGNNDVVLVDLGFCLSDTSESTVGCTKSFAAPEVISGRIGDIDARTDIFSVGCLLQWIEENTEKELSAELNQVKQRCLQPQKSARYTSAQEIVHAINKADYQKKLIIALTILTLLLVGYVAAPSLYQAASDRIAWAMGRVEPQFEANGIYYRITDDTERTVSVTFKGNDPHASHDEYAGEITIPSKVSYKSRTFRVTSLDKHTFNNPYISRVHLPEGIVTIPDSALCKTNLTGTIRIPKSVEKIGVAAFYPMLYVDSIMVHPENPYYDSRENCNAIIESATGTVLAGCNNSHIPDGVKCIAPYAFVGAKSLKHITLPTSLKEISYATFTHSGLETIDIPDSITVLPPYAFQYCDRLRNITLPPGLKKIELAALSHCGFKEVVIPDSVNTIGDYALDCCEQLQHVTIGQGVRHIGYGAFEGCSKLQRVVSRIPADSLFEVDKSVFNRIAKDAVLYVPRGAKRTYEHTDGWNNFSQIREEQ